MVMRQIDEIIIHCTATRPNWSHCKGHNSTTIGVSLFGGHGSSERDTFNEHYTIEQGKALRQLLADLSDTYGIKKISPHHRYAPKACPGFDVPRWLARKPAAPVRTKAVQSKTIQASATQMATGAGGAVAALAALDGTAQLVPCGSCGSD
jgi:N-acetyl-anhydromuramyl-L-alanine amidase AmpD